MGRVWLDMAVWAQTNIRCPKSEDSDTPPHDPRTAVANDNALGGKASQLSIQLGHEIFKPGDRVWNGKRYTWIAFGKEPLYSPNQQLTNTSGHVPQPLRTKLLAAALMPHLQRALPSTPPTVETGPDHTRGNGDCAHAAASDADAADPAGDGEPSDAALDRLAQAQRRL